MLFTIFDKLQNGDTTFLKSKSGEPYKRKQVLKHRQNRILHVVSNVLKTSKAKRCSVKNVFLEISQNSQQNTCASLFSNKGAG